MRTLQFLEVIGLAVLTMGVAACSKLASSTTLSWRMSNHEKGVELKLNDLTIVIAGVDYEGGTQGQVLVSKSHKIGGGKDDRTGGLEIQSDHGVVEVVVQKGEGDSATYLTFTIEDSVKRLSYKNESYAMEDGPKTIVIAEDGTASLQSSE